MKACSGSLEFFLTYLICQNPFFNFTFNVLKKTKKGSFCWLVGWLLLFFLRCFFFCFTHNSLNLHIKAKIFSKDIYIVFLSQYVYRNVLFIRKSTHSIEYKQKHSLGSKPVIVIQVLCILLAIGSLTASICLNCLQSIKFLSW